MAKDIKPIQCPNCGSIYKTELKPDFYKCQNCGTEYYLDNDDVNVYHHYQQTPPPAVSSSAVGKNAPVYTLIIAVFIIVVVYFIAMWTQPHYHYNNNLAAYKMPRSYFAACLYTNTLTGSPVYLRLGTDYIDKGNNQQDKELHAQYNDATTGRLIADRIMNPGIIKRIPPYLQFQALSNHQVYMLADNMALFQLDARNNTLADVTQRAFNEFPQLSSGIAKIDFEMDKDVLVVLNNEGNTFYYFPVMQQLVASADEMYSLARLHAESHYYEFASPGDVTDINGKEILREVKYWPEGKQFIYRDLTPKRVYYHPQLLYQDQENLVIATNTTPADDPPVSLQCIDAHTGIIKWTYPPNNYWVNNACKCRQGFAVEYRTGQEADYIHGVLVISPAGKLIYNYKLARTE